MVADMTPWRLYYDGGCNLCHTSQLRAERWAKRYGQELVAMPLQSAEAQDKGYNTGAMVLEADRVYTAGDAWIKLLSIAPWPLRLLYILARIPGLRQLIHLGYAVVDRYRLKWFGTRTCELPRRQG